MARELILDSFCGGGGASTGIDRSARRDVRNPLLTLPAVRRLQRLSPEARDALAEALGEIRVDARGRAEKCWRTHKAPMAAYWKAVSVYAGHLARIVRTRSVP